MSPDFVELVRQGVAITGSQKNLALDLGLSEQTISRVVQGKGYPFGELNCLKLARLLEVRGSVVLRAANKAALADLWDETHPPARAIEAELNALAPADRAHIVALIHSLAAARRAARRR